METTDEERKDVKAEFHRMLASTIDKCVEEESTTAEAFAECVDRLAEIGAANGVDNMRVSLYVGNVFGKYCGGNGKKMTAEMADKIKRNAGMAAADAVICPPERPEAVYR